MAWTTPLVAVASNALTASQWNASVRDNFAETEPGKAASTGGLIVTSAANTIAQRTPSIARVATSQTTTSTTFVDLATAGPAVATLATGASAIFVVSSFTSGSTANQGGYMGCAVSGATTVAADVTRAMRVMSGIASEISRQSYIGLLALTAGSNTFTAKYASTNAGSTATFSERELLVIPL